MYNHYDYSTPRPRKVKHVKFFKNALLDYLEDEVNNFADKHHEYKILGIKLMQDSISNFIAIVTYLEDAKGVEYGDYYDDTDKERDID